MGVYIFNWKVLKEYLIRDEENPESEKTSVLIINVERRPSVFTLAGCGRHVGTIEIMGSYGLNQTKKTLIFPIKLGRFTIATKADFLNISGEEQWPES